MTVHQKVDRSVTDTDGGAMHPAAVRTTVPSFWTPRLRFLLGTGLHSVRREYGPVAVHPGGRLCGRRPIHPPPSRKLLARPLVQRV
ncbi:hypothetical protein GCM10010211_43160 [Streptomyces albospinus]|uniref:Uncharacterized protein n=1 Tax=Streptomyces albospinus TaxID=285515 RepID=A0ABQ2V8U2_9ACTN|nr:hypothetical protein [Streptomyces albospinus]GGU72689.1 hypothetical protein GCM10010211_43160 [Streptomyces albospinus]